MSARPALPPRETVPDFDALGVTAFTTTRDAGDFGLSGDGRVGDVLGRWALLRESLDVPRLASAHQVHGARLLHHAGAWSGWLRDAGADGHVTTVTQTAVAVSVADCVPVFLAHARGAIAVLHAGWRGTEAQILAAGVVALLTALAERGVPVAAGELRVHLGPAICGACYEVSPDVFTRLTGRAADGPAPVDLRAILSDQARALGVRAITVSPLCTRCHNGRLYSHRAGDRERQVGVACLAAR